MLKTITTMHTNITNTLRRLVYHLSTTPEIRELDRAILASAEDVQDALEQDTSSISDVPHQMWRDAYLRLQDRWFVVEEPKIDNTQPVVEVFPSRFMGSKDVAYSKVDPDGVVETNSWFDVYVYELEECLKL